MHLFFLISMLYIFLMQGYIDGLKNKKKSEFIAAVGISLYLRGNERPPFSL